LVLGKGDGVRRLIRLAADENAAFERAGQAPLGLMRTALGELEAAF
jgi:hypothetical protein